MSDLRARLVDAFREEHRDYLAGLRAFLDKLGQSPREITDAERQEAFRRAHSLKAAARVCDFRTVEQIGQRLETVIRQSERGTVGQEVVASATRALSAVEEWAQRIDAAEVAEPIDALAALDLGLAGPAPASAPDPLAPGLLAAFEVEHREHLEEIRAILARVAGGSIATPNQVDDAFRRAHSLKGAARIAGVREVETVAHRLETLFAAAREGRLRLDAATGRVVERALGAIEDAAAEFLAGRSPAPATAVLEALAAVLQQEPPARAELAPTAPSAAAPARSATAETVRVRAEHLDRLLRSAGQLLTETQRQSLLATELAALARTADELSELWRGLSDAPAFDPVQQRVLALRKAARALRRGHQLGTWDLHQQVQRLQADAQRLRTVSAESVFQGFRKMVRDLAQSEGKQVDFQAAGFELHADRLVLQALKDPLMHALANAVTHGIEPPEERLRAGKDETGRVVLRLETAGNRLRVEVEDDGRGIDVEQVTAAAVRSGLVSASEAAGLPHPERARLIFRPGLSTLRDVTDVSGRGMGLSVVHDAVTRLQGDVDVDPREGTGTRILISVPLSIATQRLQMVACRGQTFGIPVHAIERLLRVKTADLETVEGRSMLLQGGRPVPVRTLADLLGLEGEAPQTPHALLILLRSGAARVALAVDALLAQRDGFIKSLDAPSAKVKMLAGGIVLEDGAVALVLNPAELLQASPARPAATTLAPVAAKRVPTVLVVDDSLTTRTLEKSILEAHGYTVRIATDGVEALAQLRAEPVDLVITDLQMPRMDGFELLAEIKKDTRLAHLPVIVVTSMAKREDQERGLALGADAYIVKRKFDHEELLGTIRQIL